jgi:hypothetical protein
MFLILVSQFSNIFNILFRHKHIMNSIFWPGSKDRIYQTQRAQRKATRTYRLIRAGKKEVSCLRTTLWATHISDSVGRQDNSPYLSHLKSQGAEYLIERKCSHLLASSLIFLFSKFNFQNIFFFMIRQKESTKNRIYSKSSRVPIK